MQLLWHENEKMKQQIMRFKCSIEREREREREREKIVMTDIGMPRHCRPSSEQISFLR